MVSAYHLFPWILYFIPVALSGGTIKVGYRSFKYAGCSEHSIDCQMQIIDFELIVDGVVSVSTDTIDLPVGNPVTLLGNADVPFLKDPFIRKFSDANGRVGIFFKAFDITNGSLGQLIDSVDENIRLHQYDMSIQVKWEEKVRTRGEDGKKSYFFFFLKLDCDDNFTGPGCGDCKDHFFTAECDVYCKPVTQQYNCIGEGVRECLGNFGPAGDCRKCNKGWGGSNCETCDIGWTGSECDRCNPQRVGSNCDICADGWTGDECDTCADNYYPTGNCTVHCISDTNFACTASGVRLCTIGTTAEECMSHDVSPMMSLDNPVTQHVIMSGMISGLTAALLAGTVWIIVIAIKRRRRRSTTAEPIVFQARSTQQETVYEEMDDFKIHPIIPEPGVYND